MSIGRGQLSGWPCAAGPGWERNQDLTTDRGGEIIPSMCEVIRLWSGMALAKIWHSTPHSVEPAWAGQFSWQSLTFPKPPTPQARGASLSQALASSSRSDEASGRASARVGCTARDPLTMLTAPLALQLTRITDVCKGSTFPSTYPRQM